MMATARALVLEHGRMAAAAGREPPSLTFSIREVATMVGIAPHTIRAWERRYDVVTPWRTSGNQRRYSSEDVEALVRVKHAVTARRLSLRLAAFEQSNGSLRDSLPAAAEVRLADGGGYEPDHWRSAADVLPYLMLILDLEGRVVDVNIAVARAVGTVRSQLCGLPFADLVDAHDRAKAVRLYRSPVEERRGWALNLRIAKLVGLFVFDCRLVGFGGEHLIVAVGRGVPSEDGGSGSRRDHSAPAGAPIDDLAVWPETRRSGGQRATSTINRRSRLARTGQQSNWSEAVRAADLRPSRNPCRCIMGTP